MTMFVKMERTLMNTLSGHFINLFGPKLIETFENDNKLWEVLKTIKYFAVCILIQKVVLNVNAEIGWSHYLEQGYSIISYKGPVTKVKNCWGPVTPMKS